MKTETVDEFLERGGVINRVTKRSRGPRAGVAAMKKVTFRKWATRDDLAEKVLKKTKGNQSSRGTKFSVKINTRNNRDGIHT